MAIDTNNKKLGVMEFCNMLEPGLPLSPGTLGQDDKQQLLWGYPGILWGGAAATSDEITPRGGDDAPRDDLITRRELRELEAERYARQQELAALREAERLAKLAASDELQALAIAKRQNAEIILLMLDDEIRRKTAANILIQWVH